MPKDLEIGGELTLCGKQAAPGARSVQYCLDE
jgi:hypothetical protein